LKKHKIFLSYYHKDDEWDRNRFELSFGHLFVHKSVEPGDIDSDLSAVYIKQLIQSDYISDSSVVIVLVGKKTLCRRHVDWEISAALNQKVGGYSGLVGILLPDFPLLSDGNYRYADIPQRLADNVKSGYADMYSWAWVCANDERIKNAVDAAFAKRVEKEELIDNSRLQMKYDTCE
jgi:hypothetical protein